MELGQEQNELGISFSFKAIDQHAQIFAIQLGRHERSDSESFGDPVAQCASGDSQVGTVNRTPSPLDHAEKPAPVSHGQLTIWMNTKPSQRTREHQHRLTRPVGENNDVRHKCFDLAQSVKGDGDHCPTEYQRLDFPTDRAKTRTRDLRVWMSANSWVNAERCSDRVTADYESIRSAIHSTRLEPQTLARAVATLDYGRTATPC